jgi:hypothetical protein
MLRGLLLLCFFFSFSAHAQKLESSTENILSGVNAQGRKVFLLRYVEERVWRVEEIVEDQAGWPDVVSRRYYRDPSDAIKAQSILQSQLVYVQSVTPMSDFATQEVVLQGGSIWPTTQTWSWEWEKKYGQWVTDNITTDFFKKYKVATDCADVAYATRWIFARIHGLPMINHLASGVLMSNQSLRAEWEKLPTAKNWYEDKRFMTALNYVLNLTYTHSLIRDSYPIAINADNFLPGAHFLNVREVSGHTRLVHRVDLSEQSIVPFQIVESTTPRKVRELNEALFWGDELPEKGKSGFLRILWPKIRNGVYSIETAANMPGYSLEQYEKSFIHEKDRAFSVEVMLHLKPDLNFVNVLKTGYQNLKAMFKSRVTVVEDGYRLCPNRSCDPKGETFDAWSTPSRDKHITEVITQLKSIFELSLPKDVKTEMVKVVAAELMSPGVTLNGEDYSVAALIFAWRNKIFSSDPNDEPGIRWAIAPEFFSGRLKNNLQKYLTERKAKISPESDNILRNDFAISRGYCKAVSEPQCLRFKNQELAANVNVNGKTQSLQTWLDQAMWLNSDPLQTPANQWGALRSQANFQELDANLKTFLVSADGIGFIENSKGEKRVGPMSPQGLIDTALPAGFKWATFQKGDGIAWATADGQLLKYDFKNHTQTIFTSPLSGDAEIILAGKTDLLVKAMGELWSLQLAGTTTTTVWHEPVQKTRVLQERIITIEQAGQNKILDFTGGLVPFSLLVSDSLVEAYLMKVTPKYFGFSMGKKSFFINRASAEVIDVTALGIAYSWSDSLGTAILWKDGAHFIKLNSKFEVVSSRKLGDFVNNMDGYVFVMNMATPGKLYKFVGDDLIEIKAQSDEEGPVDFAEGWSLWRFKSDKDKYRLRNEDGSEVLYEGSRPHFIRGQKEMKWVLQRKKDDPIARLINLKKPGAAFMTGDFDPFQYPNMNTTGAIFADRGMIISSQGYKFWIEFP